MTNLNEKRALQKVPTYEEWQKLLSCQLALKAYESPEIQKILIDWRTGELDRKFNKLEAENAKLKNLLKEVRGKLKYINTPRNNHNIFGNDLMKKINQALGED